MANTCTDCELKYFCAIKQFYKNSDSALDYLRFHGVLPSQVNCPSCNKECTLSDGQWRCNENWKVPNTKKRRRCSFSLSDYHNSFLSHCSMPPWKVVLLVNQFLQEIWDHDTVVAELKLSIAKSVAWSSACAQVTQNWLSHQAAIGGDGVIVEIGETALVRRHSKSRRVLGQVELFAGVERVSKKKFVVILSGEDEPVSDSEIVSSSESELVGDSEIVRVRDGAGETNSKDGENIKGQTLISHIKKFIIPGSTVISKDLKEYKDLDSIGYIHQAFTGAESKTQLDTIEKLWRYILRQTRKQGNRSTLTHLKHYVSRYLFLSAFPKDRLLHQFFTECARLYRTTGEIC